jgi:hypothetical protein
MLARPRLERQKAIETLTRDVDELMDAEREQGTSIPLSASSDLPKSLAGAPAL